jgi:hypothetical protein
MKNTFFLAIILVSTLLIACKKEPLEADPAKLILGKWELFEYVLLGETQTVENPYGYYEYLKDSILLHFDYNDNDYNSQSKYWFSDSLLHIYTFYYIHNHPQGGVGITEIYKYSFFDSNNKLKLDDRYSTSWVSTKFFKRIN